MHQLTETEALSNALAKRTGKLFPGPHLYAGAAIVVLWAAASALVPSMQKGSDSARNAHIALNTLNLALFAWQVSVCSMPMATGCVQYTPGLT